MNWGKLFKLTNADGKVIDWHLPSSLLAGDGAEYREDLHSLGLRIESRKADRDYLHEYLSTVTTANKARRVDRVGWHGDVYVTNNGHIGQSPDDERIVFAGAEKSKIGQNSGSRADWQENSRRLRSREFTACLWHFRSLCSRAFVSYAVRIRRVSCRWPLIHGKVHLADSCRVGMGRRRNRRLRALMAGDG